MDYLEHLGDLEAQGTTLERGSEEERLAIDRFQGLLADLKAESFRERIAEVYAEDVYFNDTLKTVRGVRAVEEYLGQSADAVEVGTVEFLDLVVDNGNYYFRWKMDLEFKRFAKGKLTTSLGMTHIRFGADGKVILHQDYWDSTGGLFEHVPVIGWMLGRAKARL